jgi:hypothetical protein
VRSTVNASTDLDPSVTLESLEDADESKRGQPEHRLGREQHEQQVQVVLQRNPLDLAEQVSPDNREREQDGNGDHGCGGKHRERRAHHLADAIALPAPVGVGDEPGDP